MAKQMWFVIALVAMSSNLSAKVEIPIIATYEIPGLVMPSADHGFRGPFYALGERLVNFSGVHLKLQVLPPKRALMYFQQQKILAFYPATQAMLPQFSFVPCVTRKIGTKRDFIFYRGSDRATSLADLKGKLVGITRGFPFTEDVVKSNQFQISDVRSAASNMVMLKKGRIDYFIADEFVGLYTLKKLALKGISYAKDSPISTQEGFVAFLPTVFGRKVCHKFDQGLAQLIDKGWDYLKLLQQLKESVAVESAP